jgi:hypothetical protein
MSRPWPLLIVTKSGVLHISDPEDDGSGTLVYECRCGRALGFRGNDVLGVHWGIVTGKEDPSEQFVSGEYKKMRSFYYAGGLKLCKKCGEAKDFDIAVDSYRAEKYALQQSQDGERNRRHAIEAELEGIGAELTDILMASSLKTLGCTKVESRTVKFQMEGLEFCLRVENIDELVHERMEAGYDPRKPSTECAGAHDA